MLAYSAHTAHSALPGGAALASRIPSFCSSTLAMQRRPPAALRLRCLLPLTHCCCSPAAAAHWQVVRGKVKKVAAFGVFVELDGQPGGSVTGEACVCGADRVGWCSKGGCCRRCLTHAARQAVCMVLCTALLAVLAAAGAGERCAATPGPCVFWVYAPLSHPFPGCSLA